MLTDADGKPRKGIGFTISIPGDFVFEFHAEKQMSPKKWETIKEMFELVMGDLAVCEADAETMNDLKLHS